MIFTFVWFGDAKKAKLMTTIMGTITALLLMLGIGYWINHSYKINNYERVVAKVTASDATDRTKTWTEFTYTCQKTQSTTRIERIFFRVGQEKELLCNPENPTQAIIYSALNIGVLTSLIGAIPFAIFTLLYFLNYKSILKKELKD